MFNEEDGCTRTYILGSSQFCYTALRYEFKVACVDYRKSFDFMPIIDSLIVICDQAAHEVPIQQTKVNHEINLEH